MRQQRDSLAALTPSTRRDFQCDRLQCAAADGLTPGPAGCNHEPPASSSRVTKSRSPSQSESPASRLSQPERVTNSEPQRRPRLIVPGPVPAVRGRGLRLGLGVQVTAGSRWPVTPSDSALHSHCLRPSVTGRGPGSFRRRLGTRGTARSRRSALARHGPGARHGRLSTAAGRSEPDSESSTGTASHGRVSFRTPASRARTGTGGILQLEPRPRDRDTGARARPAADSSFRGSGGARAAAPPPRPAAGDLRGRGPPAWRRTGPA